MLPSRIALIHDWLSVYTGSERVVEQILRLFPQADLFSLVDFVPPEQRAFLQGKTVHTSFIQRLPLARRKFRAYLPLMPLAVEQFDLASYDLVISSSHAVAKGVITGPDQLHVSYIHSPIRYAWDMQAQYLRESRLEKGLRSAVVRGLLHYLRLWDLRTVNSVDVMAANSRFIARRIRKLYRREAAVIYPPVDVERFAFCPQKDDTYLTASRLVQYKRVDLIVQAFAQMPARRLVVIGGGEDLARIRALATPNVTVLGYQPPDVLAAYMQRARAFIFAAQEDFGIVPLEAQACGTPVIAYGRGGSLETVRGGGSPQPTGLFFHEQTAAAIAAAVEQFEAHPGFRPEDCRQNAERFRPERFRQEFADFVGAAWQDFQAQR
ncbi:MAG TPA: glycosyltransferase family 4 protein [Anaerolineaceae bacterium]|nr:glycosyltransferase family 4 protein [Anaerolineaceae bacterium]